MPMDKEVRCLFSRKPSPIKSCRGRPARLAAPSHSATFTAHRAAIGSPSKVDKYFMLPGISVKERRSGWKSRA